MYQRYEAMLHSQFQGLVPAPVQALLTQTISSFWEKDGVFDWYHYIENTTFSWENFSQVPLKWVFWSGAMTFALTHGSPTLVGYLCVCGIVGLVIAYVLLEVRESQMVHLDREVQVSECHGGVSLLDCPMLTVGPPGHPLLIIILGINY